MDKYEFTGETKVVNGVTLNRICALRDFGSVHAGAVGGWIERESNLSHLGNCWVDGLAVVRGDASVMEEAWVTGNAVICGRARISGDAHVYGSAIVQDAALVYGNARIYGKAEICGEASIGNKVHIYGNTRVMSNVAFDDDEQIGCGTIGCSPYDAAKMHTALLDNVAKEYASTFLYGRHEVDADIVTVHKVGDREFFNLDTAKEYQQYLRLKAKFEEPTQ